MCVEEPAAATAVADPYQVDPALAQDVNTRLESLSGKHRLEMVQLMQTVLLCFDKAADCEATVLFRHRGMLQVIGVNPTPETGALMVFAANQVMNDPKGIPPRGEMN